MFKRILQCGGLALLFFVWLSEPVSAQKRKNKDNSEEEEKVNIYEIDTLVNAVPLNRRLWHDRIDKAQKSADLSDGIEDKKIAYEGDTTFTRLLTESILEDVDKLQILLENLPMDHVDRFTENQTKIRFLTALDDMMKRYNSDMQVDGYFYRKTVTNMRGMIIAFYEGWMSRFVHENISMQTLNNCEKLLEVESNDRWFIYHEMGVREPLIMIRKLSEFHDHPYACDVIASAAKVVPNEVFNYASSTSYLRYAVERCNDPLVQTIVRISRQSRSPLRAMPFLNDVFTGRKTISEIDHITSDEDLFYQNLVRLKLENVSLANETFTSELQYRGLRYVREMNDLHEEKPPVRFKCINGLPPEVLYFILVYGQDEIYTSSFVGTFNRMMERMQGGEDTPPLTGDQLLAKVHKDKFRTFIRMCAGYNTLSTFLGTMDSTMRMTVMSDFISGLEEGREDELEGAVDVADAFGSIKDPALADFLASEIKRNFERSYQMRNKKGIVIYGLLAILVEGSRSADNSEAVAQQSGKLKLPPINLVPYNKLVDSKDIVYEQFFFYGDEDGRASYNSFLTNFRDKAKWTIEKSQYWTEIRSTQGKPIVVYANMPLEEPEDEVAVGKLCEHLESKGIAPTVMVHRGHSYHLPLTLERLQRKAKIVILGSCGGYHNLATVLGKAPDANIISSKQTGAMSINEPIIKTINDQLLAGEDINWISTWSGLSAMFAERRGPQKEMFDDYVPPHKNLGAIFIKAYRRLFNADM